MQTAETSDPFFFFFLFNSSNIIKSLLFILLCFQKDTFLFPPSPLIFTRYCPLAGWMVTEHRNWHFASPGVFIIRLFVKLLKASSFSLSSNRSTLSWRICCSLKPDTVTEVIQMCHVHCLTGSCRCETWYGYELQLFFFFFPFLL